MNPFLNTSLLDDSGMDFRAMLKAKQYAKWKKDNEDPNWGNLKATEDERRASLKETKVCIEFIINYFFILKIFILFMSQSINS